MFAGLGGAYFTVGSNGAFTKNMTAGNGFIALAAVIMGRWHPIGAILAALFFGLMTTLSQPAGDPRQGARSSFLTGCRTWRRSSRWPAWSGGCARRRPTASRT